MNNLEYTNHRKQGVSHMGVDNKRAALVRAISHDINVAINYAVSEAVARSTDTYNGMDRGSDQDLRHQAMRRVAGLLVQLLEEAAQ